MKIANDYFKMGSAYRHPYRRNILLLYRLKKQPIQGDARYCASINRPFQKKSSTNQKKFANQKSIFNFELQSTLKNEPTGAIRYAK